MMLPENVFDQWSVESLEAYGREQGLDDITRDDYYAMLQAFPDAPVGFLRIDGELLPAAAYWNAADLGEDTEIYLNRGHKEVEATLALEHDEMCEFITELLSEI